MDYYEEDRRRREIAAKANPATLLREDIGRRIGRRDALLSQLAELESQLRDQAIALKSEQDCAVADARRDGIQLAALEAALVDAKQHKQQVKDQLRQRRKENDDLAEALRRGTPIVVPNSRSPAGTPTSQSRSFPVASTDNGKDALLRIAAAMSSFTADCDERQL